MRKTTAKIKAAFENSRSLTIANTRTDGQNVWLYNKLIIIKDANGIHFSFAGWPTRTTLERLNGILDLNLSRKKGTVYYKDSPIETETWYKK